MIYIIDCGTKKLEDIKQRIKEQGHSFRVADLNEDKDCNFSSFDGLVISGTPIYLTKVGYAKYVELFSFLKSIKIPVLGICLGHQIMGLVFGASINSGEVNDKLEEIEIVKENELFKDIENKSLFKEEHTEYISLPDNFILLAKSKACNNESMKHKDRDIYGVQFHPEVSKENGKKIFENFLNMCEK